MSLGDQPAPTSFNRSLSVSARRSSNAKRNQAAWARMSHVERLTGRKVRDLDLLQADMREKFYQRRDAA